MKQFHSASLVKFFSGCKEHQDIENNLSNYPFHKNLDLIKTFIENTDFPGGIDVDEEDFKKFIVEDTFMIGIDLINDDLDEYKYLFDAFNVYFCQEGSNTYYSDQNLTREWRKTMKNAYPDSTYAKVAKKLIRKEMQDEMNDIMEGYNKQLNDLD